MNMAPELIPSILCQTEDEVRTRLQLVENLVDWVQLDVLDGSLYANHTWADPGVVGGWRVTCSLELDLMVSNPRQWIQAWRQVPAFGRAIWHIEAPIDHQALIHEVREMGKQVGLSIGPGTPLSALEPFLPSIDRVLVLGVKPGWSGQNLIPETLNTVRSLAHHPSRPLIAFDGGITEDNLSLLMEAGVQAICPNSLLFQHPPLPERVAYIRAKLEALSRSYA